MTNDETSHLIWLHFVNPAWTFFYWWRENSRKILVIKSKKKSEMSNQIYFRSVFFLILLSLPWFSFYSFGIWCKEWVIGHLNLGVVRQIIEFSNIFSSLLLTFSHTRAASVAWNGSENHRRSCSLSDQRQS